MIYFMRAGVDGPVKIGWSTNIPSRMATLQTGQPFKMNLLRILDAPRWAEQWLHQKFDALRLEGEWFSFSEEMLLIEPPNEKPLALTPRVFTVRKLLEMRLAPELSDEIDEWRRTQQDLPPRAEAARRLIVVGLAVYKPQPAKQAPAKAAASGRTPASG